MAVSAFIDFDRTEDGTGPPGVAPTCRRRLLLQSVLWFLAAMLCKSSVVMLPVALLAYAWWRRGRIKKTDLTYAAPFFVISLILGLVTVYFQLHRALGNWRLPSRTAIGRIADAGLSLAFYSWKCVLPAGLMPIYPPWTTQLGSIVPFLPWVGLAAAVGLLWTRRTPLSRAAMLGLGWFVINLLPVLGFVPMAYQHIAPVADHFAYVPLVGVVGLAAAGLGCSFDWLDSAGGEPHSPLAPPRVFLALAATAGLAGLSIASHRYAGVFVDQETEWTFNLKHNSRSPMVYLNLAFAQNEAGRLADAIASYEKAIQVDPDDPQTENGVGNFLVANDRLAQAIPHFARALAIDPTLLVTRRSLANALYKTGKAAEAVGQYRQVLDKSPDDSEMETNLGKALGDLGRQSESIAHLRRALEIDPHNAEAENSLGLFLAMLSRIDEGITHLREAVRLDPDFAEAHNNLGSVLTRAGRHPEAVFQFEEALRLKPDFAQAHNNLGFALASAGRRKEAITQFEQALKIEPGDPKTHYNLAVVLQMDGRIHEAISHLKEAVRLKPDFDDARSSLYQLEAVETLGEPASGLNFPHPEKSGK